MKKAIYLLGAIFLCAIFFTTNVSAALAFPKGDAGICAYVNVGQSIDIEKVKKVFNEVEKVGDNYIYGKTCIAQSTGGCTEVNVYADTDGWLVAYLKRNEPASKVMLWKTADLNNPVFTIDTTLMEALKNAANKAQVSFTPSDVKYYNFKWPNATSMVILVKTQATPGSSIMQFQIPANYTLYEASYYHYGYGWCLYTKVWVDNTLINAFSSREYRIHSHRNIDFYGSKVIQTGKLHKITISYSYQGCWGDAGSAGVATVLIYKKA